MPDIEFSYFDGRNPDLQGFEARSRVKTRVMSWENSWPDLLQFALHLEGPDVSEIGMTWLGSLAGMQALRAFPPQDLIRFGGGSAFVDTVWQNGIYENEQLAIPWYVDTRVIYYRREWLHKAGVDETKAFESPSSLLDAAQRLKAHGYEIPWCVPFKEYSLQYPAAWIWRNGGGFRSDDGRLITLTEPQAFDELVKYFKLQSMMPAAVFGDPSNPMYQGELMFQAGKAAMVYTGNWYYFNLQQQKVDFLNDIGIALPPGPSSVGAMYLCIWRYSIYERLAADLIRYLVSEDTMRSSYMRLGLIPSRLNLLKSSLFSTDPRQQVIAQGILKGRTFKNYYRWAAVESRLASTFNQFSADVIANPEINIEVELRNRLNAIKQKLERTILL